MGLFAKAESLRDPADERDPASELPVLDTPGVSEAVAVAAPQAGRPGRHHGLMSRSQRIVAPVRSGGLLRRTSRVAVSTPLEETPAGTEAPPEPIQTPEPPREVSRAESQPIEAAGPDLEPEPVAAPPIVEAKRARSLPERLADVSTEILDARVGLEAPGVIFTLIQRSFGLRRAAILVPDAGRQVYAPWAAEGLDRTSLRRLRLEGDKVLALPAGVTEGDALADWLKLFSTRDASGIERIYHWPCPSDDGVSAVIVAAEIDGTLAADPLFRDNLPEILQAAGHALVEHRERELGRVQASGPRDVTADPAEVIGEALGSGAQRETVLVRLTLAPLLAEASRAAPAIDTFRLAQDIALVLAHLTRETAEVVIAASPEELYLVFHGARSPDTDLWIHSLVLSLSTHLPSIERMPELPTRSIRCPNDGTTALALMSSLG